ncbi:hypothetical protein LILPANDA_262 [Klebsiella phage vB_KaeM_LilPanda]|nr:hypothetical protein LILPANDA_262 [Klebsiella phage vB_KaeM_LilPanda]
MDGMPGLEPSHIDFAESMCLIYHPYSIAYLNETAIPLLSLRHLVLCHTVNLVSIE